MLVRLVLVPVRPERGAAPVVASVVTCCAATEPPTTAAFQRHRKRRTEPCVQSRADAARYRREVLDDPRVRRPLVDPDDHGHPASDVRLGP